MLTIDEMNQNEFKYVELLTKLNVDVTNFVRYLKSERVDFFHKPFNACEQFAYEGSLCQCSLKFYEELVRLAAIYYPGMFSEVDLVAVGLLMNIYRAEMFEPYYKNVKSEATGQWEQVLSYRPKENRPSFGIYGLSAYMIAKKFFNISDDAAMAIVYAGMDKPTDEFMLRKNFPIVSLAQLANTVVIYMWKGDENNE